MESAGGLVSPEVYSPSLPKIEISSSPAPSPDPEIYPPPYTVVIRDISKVSDTYQIPQKILTLDAGESADELEMEREAEWENDTSIYGAKPIVKNN